MTTIPVSRVSAGSTRRTGKKDSANSLMVLVELARLMLTQVGLEFEITWRMLADNITASFIPGFVFATAVCLREQLQLASMMGILGKELLLSGLYTYTFDAVNQARAVEEDRINKPHRPIPAGVLTPAGAINRFRAASIIYIVVGWYFGVLKYVLVWQIATVIINLWCSPQNYFWCKTLCMTLGVGSQLSQAWKLVTPIDQTGKHWILFMAIAYPAPLIFEDVRDMAGDEAIGRVTFASLLGPLVIRVWFATIMTLMPILVHVFLFKPEAKTSLRLALCNTLTTMVCWTTVVRSLLLRDVKADRITYQLFIVSYIIVLCSGCILWA